MGDKEKKTEEQLHYESLISFFKYLVTITVIVFSAFATAIYFLIGSNFDEVKNNINNKIQPIVDNYQDAINTQKENFNEQNNISSKRFEAWALQSENYAIELTRKKVESAFKDDNIQNLLEKTAQTELEPRIKEITENKIADITNYYNELTTFLPRVIIAVDQIRSGYRSGLDTLTQLIEQSESPEIKNFSIQLYKEKASHWKEFANDYFNNKDIPQQLKVLNIESNNYESNLSSIVNNLIKIINENDNLEYVSYAFVTLSKVTKKNIEMFDFETANRVANSY